MKEMLWPFLLGLFLFSNVFPQSESDSVIYTRGLAMLDRAETPGQFMESASYFEKISSENPDHWLASYYAGLSCILAAKNSPSKVNSDQLLDKAQGFIDISLELKSNEPENHILQAFLYQVRLLADPQGRSVSFAQKADACLKKALSADSDNPRAYFLMASNVYYTPPVFKGGPKNALPVFVKAKEKFRSYKPGLSFAPGWGEKQNEEMIRLCNNVKS